MASKEISIPVERIEKEILLVRGEKVILDNVLADLYGVLTKQLNGLFDGTSNGFLRISCSN